VLAGDQHAWHLAAAALGPDEEVAAALEQVAAGAAARRGYAPASTALERAARLSPDRNEGARRLLAAGQAAGAAGTPDRAIALFAEASATADERGLRARAEHLRGRLMVWGGSPAEATSLLVSEAEATADDDPVLGATMLADAANGAVNGNDYHRAEALACRAVGLLGDRGEKSARAAVIAMLAWVLVLRGKAPQARPLLADAERLAQGLDPLGPQWPWLHLLLRTRCPLEELEEARAQSAALCERAYEAGALATLSSALLVRADAEFRLGRWDAADTTTREAINMAGDTGQAAWQGAALATRARLTAARGLEKESRDAAMTALGIAESCGFRAGLRYVHGALGFLALGLDRVDQAISELEIVAEIVAGSGMEEPTIVPWGPDLFEAYVRAGRTADARRVLATLDRQAATSETAFAGAVAARCRGMLTDEFAPAFAAALAHADRRPMPFERARTLLALGRRLHRARRRVEARERLREALTQFEELGAAAWAGQAANELRAAGARRRTSRGSALTAQELRVADAVRRGASNREIAAELFLTPKTIEFHLHQIYRKLGTRSRSQLVATLAREGASGAEDRPR
jgi:DNA-binding NarL/FixJ family response regulator